MSLTILYLVRYLSWNTQHFLDLFWNFLLLFCSRYTALNKLLMSLFRCASLSLLAKLIFFYLPTWFKVNEVSLWTYYHLFFLKTRSEGNSWVICCLFVHRGYRTLWMSVSVIWYDSLMLVDFTDILHFIIFSLELFNIFHFLIWFYSIWNQTVSTCI